MADFNEHILQSKKNLKVLAGVNKSVNDSWDWQVTISFYVAVHVANAHIAKIVNQHYRSHTDVKSALNFYAPTNLSKFNEDAYLAYVKLLNLSRRARYLCSDKEGDTDPRAHHISEKHFSKSIRLLNTILKHFITEHSVSGYNATEIVCNNLNTGELEYFTKVSQV